MYSGTYKKALSELDVILNYFNPSGKTIIDSGCGSGYLSLQLADKGAKVYGVDTRTVIEKIKYIQNKNVVFKPGKSEKLPFEKNFADVLIYYASFHHIPKEKMISALIECNRVLKKNGLAIFVEPSLEKGCYFELLKIVLDERKIQRHAYNIIRKENKFGFIPIA
jgi:ubiquinone/menaquinone biosynthesis C-methylase UbiE